MRKIGYILFLLSFIELYYKCYGITLLVTVIFATLFCEGDVLYKNYKDNDICKH